MRKRSPWNARTGLDLKKRLLVPPQSTDFPPYVGAEPDKDCARCPRLLAYRQANQKNHPDWFNGAVPSFGPATARLLVVGLAPGLQGANRTGRPFTGDYAGDLLYPTLIDFGFATGTYRQRPDDGLRLIDCMITNAVRCVPPQNKPTGAEITTCRAYLVNRLQQMPQLQVIVALGRIAHDSVLKALGCKLKDHPFAHGAKHLLPALPSSPSPTAPPTTGNTVVLLDSYHCSRYNTNTGRLTPTMFADIFQAARTMLDASPE